MATMITFVTTGDEETVSVTVSLKGGASTPIPLNVPFDISSYCVDYQPWEMPSEITVTSETAVTELFGATSPTWGIVFSPTQTIPGYLGVRANLNASLNDNLNHEVIIETSGAVSVVSPYNRVYIVDSEIINEFATIPAVVPSNPENNNPRDNTNYIIALLSIPFKLPDDLSAGVSNIVLGSLNTEIPAPLANTDLIRVTLGEIEVMGGQDNSIDYVASEYQLYLPFVQDVVELRPEWVVGRLVAVEYLIDAYTGDITVNVYNGNDTPVTTIKTSVGRTIPFTMNSQVNSEISSAQGANNEVFTAYIRRSVKQVQPGDFSNMVSDEGNISGFSGYIRAEIIELKTHATLSEQTQIKSILSSGVIIK